MNVDIGDVINQISFTHYQPTLQVRFGAPKGRVAVMLLLGHADKKAPELFDAAKALHQIGWVEHTALDAALAREAALREELAKYKDGFFQKVTDEDLKKIADFVSDGDLPTNSFFMRADAGNLANMTLHMVREVQSLRIGLTAAEQRNVAFEELMLLAFNSGEMTGWWCDRYATLLKPTESGASE